MAIHIASPHVDRLARELVAATGERLTVAVGKAIEERLARVRPPRRSPEEEERWRWLEERIERGRAELVASGWKPPTKEELEEMLGLDAY